MRRFSIVPVLAAAVAASAPPADAQKALVLFGHAGRVWPTASLTDAGDALSSAFTYGGGLALQVGRRAALRANISRSTPSYRGTTVALADSAVARTYLGGDLQLGWPGYSSLVPYILIGGGVMQSDPRDGANATVSDLAGRFGLGVNRLTGPGTLFLEIVVTAYQFSGLGLDRFQVDLGVQLGVAVALRI